jgi:uncharacterized membrane protein YfcA
MPHSELWLIPAALLAGGLNSVAGGGTFITFPALLFCGVPPVIANATNTVALFPASFTASFTNRGDLKKVTQISLAASLAVSLLGGIVGAELLIHTPEARFVRLIPWLLLLSSAVFTFGKKITDSLKGQWQMPRGAVLFSFFLVAVYGGYFGGGIGILLLASMTLFGLENLHAMNSLKNLLAGCLNGIAVMLFALHQAVDWRIAWFMVLAAMAGGFLGAFYSKKISPSLLRGFIVTVGWGLTLYFFLRGS